MHRMLKARAGFTLIEVMVALVLTAVIGAAVTSVFVTQSRFFDVQEKAASARGVSRSALNVMLSELRMIEPGGGIESASNTHITVRSPYAMGVICQGASPVVASILPVDPAMYTAGDSAFSGFAYRHDGGNYIYVESPSMPKGQKNQGFTACSSAPRPVRVINNNGGAIQNGFPVQFNGLSVNPAPVRGAPMFLYQRVTYEFKPSVKMPGRTALWRRLEDAPPEEELVAPFASSAAFHFYVSDAPTATPTVPGALNTITGIKLMLDAQSERPNTDGTYPKSSLTTSVFFKNRPNP